MDRALTPVYVVELQARNLTSAHAVGKQELKDGVVSLTQGCRAVRGLQKAKCIVPAWTPRQSFVREGRNSLNR
jgi:hypothetical protein